MSCVVRWRSVLVNVRSKRHLKLPSNLLYNSPLTHLVKIPSAVLEILHVYGRTNRNILINILQGWNALKPTYCLSEAMLLLIYPIRTSLQFLLERWNER